MGTPTPAPAPTPTGWELIGNASTNPTTDFVGTSDAQPLVFRTSDVERARIDAGGNVGIGTAAPNTKLQVEGPSDPLAALTLRRSDNNKFMRLGVGSTGVALDFDSTSTFVIQKNTLGINGSFAGQNLLFVGSDGVVGIGTSAPNARLHVDEVPIVGVGVDALKITSGGGIDVVSLLLQNTGPGGLRLRHGVGTGMAYLASSGNLGFIVNDSGTPSFPSSPQMIIAPTGIGVGTSVPNARLHIDEVPTVGVGVDALKITSGGGIDVVSLLLQNTGPGGLRLRHGVGTGMAYLASSGTLALIANDTGTPSFPSSPQITITPNGNIGIGMTTPAFALHMPAGKALRIEGGTNPADAANYFSFGGNGSFGIDAPGVPNGRFVVLNSGNIGVGTNAPTDTLSVNGTVDVTESVGINGNLFVGTEFSVNASDGTVQVGLASAAQLGVAALGSGGVALLASANVGLLAGVFDGDVQVNGHLQKSGGGFRIDHPLDPANKYLSHSFVESPEMKNVYDGIAVLDARGEANVMLSDWFEVLNENYRYQLTPIGTSAPQLHVAQEITHGVFRVAGGAPGQRISWQVTGNRKDQWARANRLVVEEQKLDVDRGHYLHPELFGQDQNLSIIAARFRSIRPSRRATARSLSKTPS